MNKVLIQLNVLLLVSVILLCETSCTNPTTQKQNTDSTTLKGNISISGAFALYPMVVTWAEVFQKEHPDVKIDISAGGAGKGMTDVLKGMVDIAMVSREVKQEEIQQGAWYIAVAKDAVLPVINTANPVMEEINKKGIRKSQLEELFTKNQLITWGKLYNSNIQSVINIYTRADACGAGEMWAKYFGKKQEDLSGIGVYGDPGVADAVKKDINGLGYNNVIYAYDVKSRKPYPNMAVIPIDLNNNGILDASENFYQNLDSVENAIRTGRYPSPPARELYLVTKGKPSNPVIYAFYQWILTEGQKYINEGGYVKLTDENIHEQLEKLNRNE